MRRFDEILQSLAPRAATQKGKLFEALIKQVLLKAPIFKDYDFKEVYLWSEFSDVFSLHKGDDGIDIMAKTASNQWVAIQCKALAPETTLNFHTHKIDKFVAQHFADDGGNFPIHQKLIFHTAKFISKDFTSQINRAKTQQCDIRIYGYYDLLDKLDIDWSAFDLHEPKDSVDNLKTKGQKTLRKHQQEALDKIKTHFLESNNKRGKVIMPCGTGKSLLAIRAIDSILQDEEIALFLAPSLALVNQMIIEFTQQAQYPNYKIFAVCSDSKVGEKTRDKDGEDLESSDLCIPPTTNPKALADKISAILSQSGSTRERERESEWACA